MKPGTPVQRPVLLLGSLLTHNHCKPHSPRGLTVCAFQGCSDKFLVDDDCNYEDYDTKSIRDSFLYFQK